jgi:hypothetical protein
MKLKLLPLLLGSATLLIMAFSYSAKKINPAVPPPAEAKIQVAVLLDVSNSMDGLIEQAKAQLWNMVSVMGKAKCASGQAPQVEIALYEYGRSTNDSKKGYVLQVSPFSQDLDEVSKKLFGLSTNGGDEYCGQVILSSVNELQWDTAAENYKVIFIAGNEDFLQGSVSFSQACAEAKKKGVIVNTIYCGDKMRGVREHWNLGTECGTGSYTNINSDAKIDDIPTPYDSTIFVLNNQLNNTYVAYGVGGGAASQKQVEVDKMNYSMNKSVAAKRVAVKSKKGLYKNTTWDLVDAQEADDKFIDKVDLKTLPDSLKNKSRAEVKKIVEQKTTQRNNIQKDIANLSVQREAFIVAERKKMAGNTNTPTLETEVEKIVREQAKRFNMTIEQ